MAASFVHSKISLSLPPIMCFAKHRTTEKQRNAITAGSLREAGWKQAQAAANRKAKEWVSQNREAYRILTQAASNPPSAHGPRPQEPTSERRGWKKRKKATNGKVHWTAEEERVLTMAMSEKTVDSAGEEYFRFKDKCEHNVFCHLDLCCMYVHTEFSCVSNPGFRIGADGKTF